MLMSMMSSPRRRAAILSSAVILKTYGKTIDARKAALAGIGSHVESFT
jgi:hypothetical protein